MPRVAKKLDYDDVTDLVVISKAIATQTKKEPLTKPQVSEQTSLPTPRITAAYKRLLKMELATQIEPPKGMPLKGVYLKTTPKGKAYCKAYDVLFG